MLHSRELEIFVWDCKVQHMSLTKEREGGKEGQFRKVKSIFQYVLRLRIFLSVLDNITSNLEADDGKTMGGCRRHRDPFYLTFWKHHSTRLNIDFKIRGPFSY